MVEPLVNWRSHQQSITALSTSEAEYMSLSDAAKEARSLLKLNKTLENESKNKILYLKIIAGVRNGPALFRSLTAPSTSTSLIIIFAT